MLHTAAIATETINVGIITMRILISKICKIGQWVKRLQMRLLRFTSASTGSASAVPAAALLLLLTGCATKAPQGVDPVTGFELERYLGRWYEIARLDHSFERGMDAVTAEYSMREDGGVRVVNRGWQTQKNEWKEAVGRAYPVIDPQTGFLKVSFFGPFYGAYVIFELDKENYEYAFVSGPDRSYLWLLARSPAIGEAVKARFIERSAELGFDTEALIFPRHDLDLTAAPAPK